MRYRKYWIAAFSIFMLALSSECRAFPLFGTTETDKDQRTKELKYG